MVLIQPSAPAPADPQSWRSQPRRVVANGAAAFASSWNVVLKTSRSPRLGAPEQLAATGSERELEPAAYVVAAGLEGGGSGALVGGVDGADEDAGGVGEGLGEEGAQ